MVASAAGPVDVPEEIVISAGEDGIADAGPLPGVVPDAAVVPLGLDWIVDPPGVVVAAAPPGLTASVVSLGFVGAKVPPGVVDVALSLSDFDADVPPGTVIDVPPPGFIVIGVLPGLVPGPAAEVVASSTIWLPGP